MISRSRTRRVVDREVEIRIELPRATRDASALFKIFQEKWHQLCGSDSEWASAVFDDRIEAVSMRTLGLESDHDRQLSLFDPRREELGEEWNVLVGQLRSRETAKHKIRIGAYQPYESYFPENSIEWVEWEKQEETRTLAPVADHPRRPLLLFAQPSPAPNAPAKSEDDFLNWVGARGSLASLERIRDPWTSYVGSRPARERLYARVDNQWLFWDHARQRVFLHGFFE